jgi:hypothetical protein
MTDTTRSPATPRSPGNRGDAARPALGTRLTALVLAAGIALAAPAAPARAQTTLGNENLGTWIAGAVALGLIARALEEEREQERDRDRRTAGRTPIYTPVAPGRGHDLRPLPASCLTTYRVGSRTVNYLHASCLDRSYRDADRLPASCRQTIRTAEGSRAVYAPGCLSDRGFRLERADWRGDRDDDDDREHGRGEHRNPWDIPGRHWR